MKDTLNSNRLRASRHRPKRNPAAAPDEEPASSTRHSHRLRNWLAFAGLVALVAAMVAGYTLTGRPIAVDVDGRTVHLRTHLPTLGDALTEARIPLQPEDRVDPPLETPVHPGMEVHIQRARTVSITVDGKSTVCRTLATTVGEALTEAGVKWIPEDRIAIGGRVVPGEQPLYAASSTPRQVAARGGRPASDGNPVPEVSVVVQRAVPISVQDGEIPYTFLTTAGTLGEALLDKEITLYAADRIDPPLDTPIKAGLSATIDRSRGVTLLADGEIRQTRTRAATVGDLLKKEGITLGEKDYTKPAVTEPISPDLQVTVVRVKDEELIEDESIPFEVEYRANPNLEIDNRQVDNWGAAGVFRRSLIVRYENGVEVSRTLDREWVETPPQNRIISYGTKIVLRQITTPEGTFTYWRKIRVLATAYSAATCGKARSNPTYGITRVGWKAQKGVIAVDPSVISLYSEMYVPGYGKGVAADTGGMIKGLHIDLCYDENNLVHWWKWVDVYVLGSPPPASQIRWTLPDYPQEN